MGAEISATANREAEMTSDNFLKEMVMENGTP
jgi:hypothetical protein